MKGLKHLCWVEFVWICTLLVGCGAGDLPEYTQLGPLRILSLKVDTPEVAPGTLVTLTPFISDLNGNGRILTYSVEGCVDPGLDRGVEPSCATSPTRQIITQGTIDPASSLTIKTPNFTGTGTPVTVTIPADILTGKTSIEQSNGIDYIILYTIQASSETTVRSIKRVRSSMRDSKNTNPTLTGIQTRGTAFSTFPSGAIPFNAKFQTGSKETYTVLKIDGSTSQYTETLVMTWFISDGTIDYTRTIEEEENTFSPPNPKPTQRDVTIIGVSRDGRGGEDVIQLTL